MNTYSRKDFLKVTTAGTLGWTLPSLGCGRQIKEPPNIIVILADDMGYSDIGCYGGEIRTPNIDRMAAEGMRFSQFYNAARCCPTRASLLTGLYPHQAGVGFMREDLGIPSYRGHLNDRCVTIAEALGNNGYSTAMVGKWHLGKDEGQRPLDRGFDRYSGLLEGSANYFEPENRTLMQQNELLKAVGDDFYMTDFFSREAEKYVDEYGRRENPFFMYLAYTAPHWPLHAPEEDIEKYLGTYMQGWDALRKQRYNRMKEIGLFKRQDWPLTPRAEESPAWNEVEDKEGWDRKMAVYAAMVGRMDRGIGRVMRKLKELNLDENTLVMFLSDNGGCAEAIGRNSETAPGGPDSFMGYHLPWANASNTPFRLYKHWVHEGGIATPLVVRWPAGIDRQQQNTINHQPGHIIDLMATCLDVSGAEYPQNFDGNAIHPLQGKSLRPCFEGESRESHSYLYWEHEGNRAIRSGNWKLVSKSYVSWKFLTRFSFTQPHKPGDPEWELYDLDTDRTELNDLSKKFPEKVKELAGQYEKWAAENNVLPWQEYMKQTDIPWLESLENIKG